MGLVELINGVTSLAMWAGAILVFAYWMLRMSNWKHEEIMDQFAAIMGAVAPNPPQQTIPRSPVPPSAAARAAMEQSPDTEPTEEEQAVMREVLEGYLAKAEAYRTDLGDKRMTVEHMVLAMAEDPRFNEVLSVAEGLDEENLKKAIRKSRVVYNRGGATEEPEAAGALAKYSRDLTALAQQGKLDPVIGRNDELRRLIDVLTRRTKSSAVLLGEAGVGKTAIVEGLAQRCADGDVPEALRGCRILALELGMLMAGATFPGEFEDRVRGFLKELTALGSTAILFIDDIHTITGPNAQQGGGVMDASLMLKPLLSRGEVRCIGCTSLDNNRKFIEKDPGLERRFQQITVEPATVTETMSILRGLRHKYAAHHVVRITDAALAAAAQLSDRYMPDRYLPDKAIDLIDEAAAKVKSDLALKPEELDRAERRIRQLEAERKLLQRNAELDVAVAAELAALEAELAGLQQSAKDMAARLEVESAESERTARLQDEVDRLTAEIDAAEEEGAAAKADDLRRARRQQLVRKLRLRQRALRGKGGAGGAGGRGGGSDKLQRGEVGEADVARVISQWTGIPLTKLVESEASKLLLLTDELHKRIIGQHEAVVAVAEAIQRSRAGMKDPNGPIASFLFLGPTGVGKTELAKALAANLFDADDALVRLDMSEYMEKHAVAKLIGAPPGYMGYGEGGQLTEQVRRKPYCVVLFDEVEKAHVDVFNLLLQLLDDGRVTDSQGRVVSFKNAIIILTSNLGSAEIYQATYQHTSGGVKEKAKTLPLEELREMVMVKVRKHFQPEFLNRIDDFIIFEPLKAAQIERIVTLRTWGVAVRLAEKKMTLQLTESALAHLAAVGFDPVYGARPVKRAVQRELETPLAKALLQGLLQEEDTVVVEAAPGGVGLSFSRIPAPVDPLLEEQDDLDSCTSDMELEGDLGGATAASSRGAAGSKAGGKGGGTSKQQQRQQQQKQKAAVAVNGEVKPAEQTGPPQPIPVIIPGHVGSIGSPTPAAAAAASSQATEPVDSSSSSSSSQPAAAAKKFDPLRQQAKGGSGNRKAAAAAALNGTSSPAAAVSAADKQQQVAAQPPAADADADEGLNLPSSYKTPRRRDEQDITADTCTD